MRLEIVADVFTQERKRAANQQRSGRFSQSITVFRLFSVLRRLLVVHSTNEEQYSFVSNKPRSRRLVAGTDNTCIPIRFCP